MNYSHNRLSRRTVLRGLGVSMALPWMESLPVWGDEASAGGRATQPPVRVAVLFAGNGFHGHDKYGQPGRQPGGCEGYQGETEIVAGCGG